MHTKILVVFTSILISFTSFVFGAGKAHADHQPKHGPVAEPCSEDHGLDALDLLVEEVKENESEFQKWKVLYGMGIDGRFVALEDTLNTSLSAEVSNLRADNEKLRGRVSGLEEEVQSLLRFKAALVEKMKSVREGMRPSPGAGGVGTHAP